MQKLYKDFFSVIKIALANEPVTLCDDIDYEKLFLLSKQHKVVPLICHGLYKAKGNFPELDMFRKYTFFMLGRDQNLVSCIKNIENIFADNGIDYMLLKGASVKRLYPTSECRLMGDADILIKEGQYNKIKELMPTLGLVEKVKSDHELIWAGPGGIVIELHKRLIPSYNDDYYAYYRNPWKKATFNSNHSFSMTKEDEYIYLFTHLTKHYRDGSAMLRPLIDIWLFKTKHTLLNMEYINKELEKLELKTFHTNIWTTLDVWFNGKDETELTEFITEEIFDVDRKARLDAANAARISARSESVSSAKAKKLRGLIFLPLSTMKTKFPILEKLPFLLPIMWVVRWIDAILHKKKSIAHETNRLSKMDNETVDAYNDDLSKVGLKFNLKKDK